MGSETLESYASKATTTNKRKSPIKNGTLLIEIQNLELDHRRVILCMALRSALEWR